LKNRQAEQIINHMCKKQAGWFVAKV
jgi:hypothetical protein